MNAGRPAFSPEFKRLFKRILFGLAVFHALFQVVWWVPLHWTRTDRDRDLRIYYDATQRLVNGSPLYEPWPDYSPRVTPSRFFYPPPFMILTRPLASLDLTGFGRAWYAILLLAFWIYAACLGKIAQGRFSIKGTLLAGLIVGICPSTYEALSSGNFEPWMWAAYGLAIALASSVPLALAVITKLHPFWALVLCWKEQKLSKFAVSALTILLVGGASIFVVGFENASQWWSSSAPVVSQGSFNNDNVSIPFFLIRIFDWLGFVPASGPLPQWAKLYLSGMTLVGPISALYLTRSCKLEWRIAWLGAATVLFSPLCWTMYIPLLFLLTALWYRDRTSLKTESAPVV